MWLSILKTAIKWCVTHPQQLEEVAQFALSLKASKDATKAAQ